MLRRPTRLDAATDAREADDSTLMTTMIILCRPVERLLTHALRSLAGRHPGAFERLGDYQKAAFLISPTGWPVAFVLTPDPDRGAVQVVRRCAGGAYVARISAPLADLLALFDGSLDADAAFFARSIRVDGDIGAVMALHNALESAELRLIDLAPLPAGQNAANAVLGRLLRAARRHAKPGWR